MELVFPGLARLFLAMVFLSSALGKLRDVHGFTSIMLDYRILPQHWARRFAGTLPWVELFMRVTRLRLRVLSGHFSTSHAHGALIA